MDTLKYTITSVVSIVCLGLSQGYVPSSTTSSSFNTTFVPISHDQSSFAEPMNIALPAEAVLPVVFDDSPSILWSAILLTVMGLITTVLSLCLWHTYEDDLEANEDHVLQDHVRTVTSICVNLKSFKQSLLRLLYEISKSYDQFVHDFEDLSTQLLVLANSALTSYEELVAARNQEPAKLREQLVDQQMAHKLALHTARKDTTVAREETARVLKQADQAKSALIANKDLLAERDQELQDFTNQQPEEQTKHQSALKEALQEAMTAREKTTAALKDAESCQSQFQKAQGKLTKLKQEVDSLDLKLSDSNLSVLTAEKKLDAAKLDFMQKMKGHEQRVDRRNREIFELRKRLAAQDAEISVSKDRENAEIQELKTKVGQLTQELSSTKSDRLELESKLAARQDQPSASFVFSLPPSNARVFEQPVSSSPFSFTSSGSPFQVSPHSQTAVVGIPQVTDRSVRFTEQPAVATVQQPPKPSEATELVSESQAAVEPAPATQAKTPDATPTPAPTPAASPKVAGAVEENGPTRADIAWDAAAAETGIECSPGVMSSRYAPTPAPKTMPTVVSGKREPTSGSSSSSLGASRYAPKKSPPPPAPSAGGLEGSRYAPKNPPPPPVPSTGGLGASRWAPETAPQSSSPPQPPNGEPSVPGPPTPPTGKKNRNQRWSEKRRFRRDNNPPA